MRCIMDYEKKQLILSEAKYLIKNNSTIRATAKHFGLPKSTLHKDIHTYLPKLNKRLYIKVQQLFDKNFSIKHIRGGESTKKYYLAKKIEYSLNLK